MIWLETGQGEMFESASQDGRFLSAGSANDHIFLENLKSEIERLQKENTHLKDENSSYSEQVRSNNQIIENLEARISKR